MTDEAGPGVERGVALGMALCRQRRFAEAVQALTPAVRRDDADAAALLILARVHLLAADRRAAEACCRQALARREPPLAERERLRAHLVLARIALLRHDPRAAITQLRLAVTLRPRAASLRARLAGLLAAGGQIEAALGTARAALARDPDCRSAALVILRCQAARIGKAARPAGQAPAGARPALADHGVSLASQVVPSASIPSTDAGAACPPPSGARILRALMLRNLQLRYGNSPLALPLELVRPICVIAAHWLLFAILHKQMPGQIPTPLFVLAGFSVWFAFNYTANGAAAGARFPGGATLLPGVSAMHLRLARAAWPLLVNLTFCLVAVLPLRLYGIWLPMPALLQTLVVFTIAGTLGLGFGLLGERLGTVSAMARPIEKLLTWALFITSGLYFVVYHTLPAFAAVLLWNPLLHLVEYERNAFDPGYPLALVELRYPAIVAGMLLLLGLAACRRFRLPA